MIIALVLGWSFFAFTLGLCFYLLSAHYWLCRQGKTETTILIVPVLQKHFGNVSPNDLKILSREFPKRVHVELDRELQKIAATKELIRTDGLESDYTTVIKMVECFSSSIRQQIRIVPLVYQEIDIGEEEPFRCAQNCIWLWKESGLPFAILFAPAGIAHDPKGRGVEIAVLNHPDAIAEAERILKCLEQAVKECTTYRRKILSLESSEYDYSGAPPAIKVHKLREVSRDQLVLPEKTVELLERNLFGFVQQRHRLRELGLQTKKGLLFHGPPGTGKTHTLHYLIGVLKEEYTTILITAEQVGQIDEYFLLARLLEPAILIIEDADIIGQQREEHGVCTETLLNKLLNEMDGLKEDADVLFLLTTNRPGSLEPALRDRPGRIDQAIDFPLPDQTGREKLFQLYSRDLKLSPETLRAIVSRTEGASAAFIKELVRRSAQFLLERNPKGEEIEQSDMESALEEMLFKNRKGRIHGFAAMELNPSSNE